MAANPRIVPFPVSNEMFLKAVFGTDWERVKVAMFAGDPAKQPRGSWQGHPAADMLRMPQSAQEKLNTYFSVGVQSGSSRGLAGFESVHVIVLDDVGPKVNLGQAIDLLGTSPNYILETSPGNDQAGWFVEPITDRDWAAGLVKMLYEALGRRGDNLKNLVGYMRLPVGTNTKPHLGPGGHRHRLKSWNPGTRIPSLAWIEVERRLRKKITPIVARLGGDKEMPDPGEIEADAIFQGLKILGQISGPGRPMTMGWGFDIRCPWIGDHSERASEGTSYVPVTQKFRCHHGHCQDRNAGDLREWVDEKLREDSGGVVNLAGLEFDEIDPKQVPGPRDQTAVGRDLASYEATEDGLALAFAAEHKGKLRFDGKRKKWFVWTGTYWREDATERAFVWARELLRRFRKGSVELTPGQARAWGKIAAAAAVERAARAHLSVEGDKHWDQDIWLAGCPGGEIDLKTGVLRPPDPAHGITKQLLVAPDFTMKTPLWDKFLWETTGGDIELIDFLQGWYGYNLTGDVAEEKFVFEYGTGGNGKGTINFTIAAILNDYATRCDVDMFMVRKYKPHSEEVARLMGIRMVTTTESEENRTFDVVRLKDLTGRDGKLTGAFKYEHELNFTAQFKLTIIGNNYPKLPGVDAAMKRRLILPPFTQTPANPDITLKDRLVDEYPGILAWLIRGEQLRRTSGGLDKLVPERARLATDEYLTNQDTIQGWAEERCLFGPGEQMGVSEAFEDYRSWCIDQHEATQAGIRDFAEKFVAKFPECKKTKNNKAVITEVRLL